MYVSHPLNYVTGHMAKSIVAAHIIIQSQAFWVLASSHTKEGMSRWIQSSSQKLYTCFHIH